MYEESEYINKKQSIIYDLAMKKLNVPVEDFLSELISLKEQSILSSEEIMKIKKLVV